MKIISEIIFVKPNFFSFKFSVFYVIIKAMVMDCNKTSNVNFTMFTMYLYMLFSLMFHNENGSVHNNDGLYKMLDTRNLRVNQTIIMDSRMIPKLFLTK